MGCLLPQFVQKPRVAPLNLWPYSRNLEPQEPQDAKLAFKTSQLSGSSSFCLKEISKVLTLTLWRCSNMWAFWFSCFAHKQIQSEINNSLVDNYFERNEI